MKKFFALALVSILLISAAAASGQKESGEDLSLQNVVDKGTFVLGLDDSFPPMGFRDENGEIVGFDIDVAREVASRLGTELVPQPIDWNAKEQELATGNIVGVQAGSSAQIAIDDTEGFRESLDEVVEFKENLTALMDLEIGGVDAVVMDLLVANDNINRSGKDFRILDETLTEEEYAIGFRKNDIALRDAVNAQLEAMAADGSLAEIAVKWFGADITIVGK